MNVTLNNKRICGQPNVGSTINGEPTRYDERHCNMAIPKDDYRGGCRHGDCSDFQKGVIVAPNRFFQKATSQIRRTLSAIPHRKQTGWTGTADNKLLFIILKQGEQVAFL